MPAQAQTVETNQAGAWDDPNTWIGGSIPNSFNSTSISINHAIFIPSGYSVTVDGLALNNQLTVNTGGTLNLLSEGSPGFTQNNVSGTIIRQDGSSLTGSTGANLVFASGSTYRHQFTATEGNIPLAIWNAGSTLSIEGYTTFASATVSGNWSQTFGDVTWNCAAQTGTLNLNGLLTTVQGDLTLQSTNTGVVQFSIGQNPTITVGENFSVLGTSRFNLSTTGAAPGVVLNVGGNFIFNSTNISGSYLGISGTSMVNITGSFNMEASGGVLGLAGAGTTGSGTLNINGNFVLTAGTITELGGDPTQGNINFTGSNTTHTFLNSGTISQRINYSVPAGHTLRMLGESQMVGSTLSALTVGGTLILESINSTGAIITGAGAGLGQVRVGVRNFSAGSHVIYNGAAQQAIGNGHPSAAGVIVEINNASGVVLATTVATNADLVINSGNVTVANGNFILGGSTVLNGGNLFLISASAARTLTINGALTLGGGGVSVASGAANANLVLGGTIGGGGYIYFTGANTAVTVNGSGPLGRSFPVSGPVSIKTLTVSRTGGTIVFDEGLTTVGLTINNGNLDMNAALTVTNDVNLASGTTLFIEDQTVELQRYFNRTITGGLLSANGNTTLNIVGTSGVMGTLEFAPGGDTIGDLVVNRTGTGVTILLNSPLTITKNLTLTDGIIQNTSGLTLVNGVNVIRNSNASFQTGSVAPLGGPYNLTLTGTASMTTGAEVTGQLNNVVCSAATVTLGTDLTVIGDFTLSSGTFRCGAFNMSVRTLTNQAAFIAPTGVLALTGDFINDGTFTRNGTVAFNGVTSISGSTNPTFNNIVINGTLNAPSVLPVYGSFTNNGSFVAGSGTVSFLGTAGVSQVVNGTATTAFHHMSVTNTTADPDVLIEGRANLEGILTIGAAAIVDADGASGAGVFTVLSTNDNPVVDGAIAALTSVTQLTGNVTVQRYMSIEGGSVAPYSNGRIYRYISSPVQGATVADIQQEIPVTGGFTGHSVCSGCNNTVQSMARYDETVITDNTGDGVNNFNDGYVYFPVTSNEEMLQAGLGYSLFVRGNQAPISTSGNARWDVRGPINGGTVVYNATYTSSGNNASDGWNLVGNPYPSTIDWNAASGWTKTGIANTIYMTDNGGYAGGATRYATFNGTVGTNGGSRYIPMGQAFFIKSNGGTINFRSTEAVKAPGAATIFFREAAPANVLRIALRQGQVTDETVIHYRQDATAGYDPDMDAYKMANEVLNLSSMLQDGGRLAINSVPASLAGGCGSVINLDVANVAPGSYDLYFSNLDSFTDKMYFTLHDAYLGKSMPVTHATVYPFEVMTDAGSFGDARFSLTMSTRPVAGLSDLATGTVCPGQDGKISIPASVKGYTYVVQSGQDTVAQATGSGTLLEITIARDKLMKGVNSFVVTVKNPVCANLSNQATSTIAVTDVAPASIMLTAGDKLASNYSDGNTWYLDGEWMSGVQSITAEKSGAYKLCVQTQGCRLETSRIFVISQDEGGYAVYPNPVRRSMDLLTIETSSDSGETFTILDTTGDEIAQIAVQKTEFQSHVGTFDFAGLPAGIYFLRIREGSTYRMIKILIL